jgi:hypothetical protein
VMSREVSRCSSDNSSLLLPLIAPDATRLPIGNGRRFISQAIIVSNPV